MPTLSPEAAIEIPLPTTLDMYALAGAWPFGATGSFGAVAGEFPCVVISNISTNMLLTVTLRMSSNSAVIWQLARGVRLLDGAGPILVLDQTNADYLDTRRTRGNFPTGISAGGITFQASTTLASTLVGLNRVSQRRQAATAEAVMPEVVLAPGESISCLGATANATMIYEATGFIRNANQDELATP